MYLSPNASSFRHPVLRWFKCMLFSNLVESPKSSHMATLDDLPITKISTLVHTPKNRTPYIPRDGSSPILHHESGNSAVSRATDDIAEVVEYDEDEDMVDY